MVLFFASLSVGINLMFHFVIPIKDTFGLPYYAIPLVIGGFALGPFYGLIIALVADTAYGIVVGYMPLFTISSLFWGFVPALLIKDDYKLSRLAVIIVVTYLLATISNTFAMYIYFGPKSALATLPLRLISLGINSFILVFLIDSIYQRLKIFLDLSDRKTVNQS